MMLGRAHRILAVAVLALLLGPMTVGWAHATAHRDVTGKCALCRWVAATPALLPAALALGGPSTWTVHVATPPASSPVVTIRGSRIRGPPSRWTEPHPSELQTNSKKRTKTS